MVSRTRFRVLLVEDNPDHATLVQESLGEFHRIDEIHWLQDGEQALQYLRRTGAYSDPDTSPRPDMILLDLRLPKIDGLEVLQMVKNDETLRSIPVVVLTSSSASPDVTEAYHHNANSYLVKPVTYQQFVSLMDLLGQYWMSCNRAELQPRCLSS